MGVRRLISLFLNVGLLLGALTFSAFAAECALWVMNYNAPVYVDYEKYKDVNKLYRPNTTSHWYGPLGVVVDYDNIVVNNSLAFHDVEHAIEKPEGVYRILVLGDSYVESQQVLLEETFFRILENKLNAEAGLVPEGKKVEIIAMGNSGNGSVKEATHLVHRGIQFKPDLVLCFLTDQNDFHDDWHHDRIARGVDKRKAVNFLPRDDIKGKLAVYEKWLVLKGSRLNRWLAFQMAELWLKWNHPGTLSDDWKDRLGVFAVGNSEIFPEAETKWEDAFRVTASNYIKMNAFAERNGADFAAVFVDRQMSFVPEKREFLYRLIPGLDKAADFDKPTRRMGLVLDQVNIPYLDLNHIFKVRYDETGITGHFKRDSHWNQEGHALTAAALKQFLTNYWKVTP